MIGGQGESVGHMPTFSYKGDWEEEMLALPTSVVGLCLTVITTRRVLS